MHVALLSDIVIILIIVIITLMIYRDMKFLLLPIPKYLYMYRVYVQIFEGYNFYDFHSQLVIHKICVLKILTGKDLAYIN